MSSSLYDASSNVDQTLCMCKMLGKEHGAVKVGMRTG